MNMICENYKECFNNPFCYWLLPRPISKSFNLYHSKSIYCVFNKYGRKLVPITDFQYKIWLRGGDYVICKNHKTCTYKCFRRYPILATNPMFDKAMPVQCHQADINISFIDISPDKFYRG